MASNREDARTTASINLGSEFKEYVSAQTGYRIVEYTVSVTPVLTSYLEGFRHGLIRTFELHHWEVDDIPTLEEFVDYTKYLLDFRVKLVKGEKTPTYKTVWLPPVIAQLVAAIGKAKDPDYRIIYVPKSDASIEGVDVKLVKKVADFIYSYKNVIPATFKVPSEPDGNLSAIRFTFYEGYLFGLTANQAPEFGVLASLAGFQRICEFLMPSISYGDEDTICSAVKALAFRETTINLPA